MKITTDLRRYTAPARGSNAWKKVYNLRTAVERVNAYLKEFFQLNNVRYRTGKRAKIHFDIVTLIYNASKLAVDRINTELSKQAQTAQLKGSNDQFYLCGIPGSTKTPAGKATAENPFHKFCIKLMTLVEALPAESVVDPDGTQLAQPSLEF